MQDSWNLPWRKCNALEDGIYEMFMLENWRPQCLVQFPSNLVQTILFQSPKWILKKDSMFKMKTNSEFNHFVWLKSSNKYQHLHRAFFVFLGKTKWIFAVLWTLPFVLLSQTSVSGMFTSGWNILIKEIGFWLYTTAAIYSHIKISSHIENE